MSKEYLEAFKNLKQELYYSPNQIPDIDKWHEIIERALQRLEAIDNANPSEALKCLEVIENALWDDDFHYQRHSKLLDTIEQALLKAQELPEPFKTGVDIGVIKPKQYLKWEDLEFKELEFKVEQKKDFKVKLNDTEYGLEICITFGIKEALIFDEKKVLYAVFHERHKQFFNDLHLERVE